MELHEKILELRKKKGMTQEELARCLYVSRAAVSKWESGRGYPNIESLKALAAFFSVTVDELLSGEELLTLAEEDSREKASAFYDLAFGALDLGTAMLFILPFFGESAEGDIRSVFLLALGETAPYLKAAYIATVTGIAVLGLLTLLMQSVRGSRWAQGRRKCSLLLNAAAVLLFVISRQPYPAVLLLFFLGIKVLMLIKWE